MIYAGIDEAGYGPILGPLCVASSVFEVPDDLVHAEAGAPDLWAALAPVVCRTRKEASSSCLAVADSKELKLANSVKRHHPLHHLEIGVLAFGSVLGDAGQPAATEAGLFQTLHCEPGDLPWYVSASDRRLPLGTTADHLRLLSTRLRSRCDQVGVSVREMCCAVTCERRFNDDLRRCATKAELSFLRVAALVRRVWKSDAALECDPGACPRVVVDRQGGRTRYAESLARAVPGASINILGESAARSVYELHGGATKGERRRVRVSFEVEAETRHLPVALASMSAKFVRELLMNRLNEYWSARCTELKPTAGYATDGGRYLGDLKTVATPDELRVLRRNA